MTDSQTRFTYRLLDANGATLEEEELPTDGEALTWAEDVRAATPGLAVRRVERRSASGGWELVEEAGTAPVDKGSEDV
jgi:hypothetical protein